MKGECILTVEEYEKLKGEQIRTVEITQQEYENLVLDRVSLYHSEGRMNELLKENEELKKENRELRSKILDIKYQNSTVEMEGV